jgi:hypothetical protein
LSLPPSLGIPDICGINNESRIHLSSGMNPGYILDKSGMLDESGIYPEFIWDISGISQIIPEYIPDSCISQINLEYIQNTSRKISQIYLGSILRFIWDSKAGGYVSVFWKDL